MAVLGCAHKRVEKLIIICSIVRLKECKDCSAKPIQVSLPSQYIWQGQEKVDGHKEYNLE